MVRVFQRHAHKELRAANIAQPDTIFTEQTQMLSNHVWLWRDDRLGLLSNHIYAIRGRVSETVRLARSPSVGQCQQGPVRWAIDVKEGSAVEKKTQAERAGHPHPPVGPAQGFVDRSEGAQSVLKKSSLSQEDSVQVGAWNLDNRTPLT